MAVLTKYRRSSDRNKTTKTMDQELDTTDQIAEYSTILKPNVEKVLAMGRYQLDVIIYVYIIVGDGLFAAGGKGGRRNGMRGVAAKASFVQSMQNNEEQS